MESRSQENNGNADSQQAESNDMPCEDAQRSILMAAKTLESFDSGACLQSELSTPTFVGKLSVNDLREASPDESCTSSYKIPTAISNSLSKHLLALHEGLETHLPTHSSSNEYHEQDNMYSTNADDKSFFEHQQLTERVSSLVEENNTNMETLRRAEDKLEYSEGQLAVKESEILKLKEELELRQSENEQLVEKVISTDMERNMLQEEVNESKKQLQQATDALFNHAKEANGLVESYRMQSQSENQLLAEEKQALSAENTDLKTKLRETTDLLHGIEAEKQKKEGDTVKALMTAQERITDLLQELDQNQGKVKSMEEQMERLIEANKEDARSQKEQMQLCEENLTKEKNELEDELQRITNEWKASENRIKDFQARIDSMASQHGVEPAASDSATSQGEHAPTHKLSEIDLCLAKKDAYIKRLEAEKMELADAVHKNELLEIEISSQKRNAKTENLRLIELETLCETLQKANQDLNQQTGEYSERASRLQSECDSLESRLNERTTQLISTKDELKSAEDLEQRMKEKDLEIVKLCEETAALKNTTDEYTLRITTMENELANKDMCLETQKDRMATVIAEHRSITDQMTDEYNQQMRTITENHDKMMSEAEEFRNENRQLRDKIEQLTKDLNLNLNEVELLGQELEATRAAEDNNAKCHNMALQNLQDMATNDTKRVKLLELELDSCKTKLSVHVEQIEVMQNEYNNNLTSKNQQISELETQMRLYTVSLDEEIESKKLLEQSLKDRISIVKQLNDRVMNLEDIKESLEMEISVVNAKNFNVATCLREAKDKYEAHLTSMEQNINCKETRTEELLRQLRSNEEEMGAMKETLEYQQQQINDCIVEREGHVITIEQLETELAERKKQLHKKIEDAEAIKNDLHDTVQAKNSVEHSCKELEKQVVELQSNYEELERKYEVISEHNKGTETALSVRADELTNLEEQNRKLQLETEEKDRELYEVQIRLEEQQYDLSLRKDQVSQLTVRISQFQSEKETMVVSLRQRVQEMRDEIESRVKEMRALDKELTTLREEKKEARTKLEEKNKACESLRLEVKAKEEKISKLEELLESKDANVLRDIRLSREREQNAETLVMQCRKELEVLYAHLNKVRSESKTMANCIYEKEEEVDRLEACVKDLKKEMSAMEKKHKEEFMRARIEDQRLLLVHEEELEKLKEQNQYLLAKSSEQSQHGNEVIMEINELRSKLINKDSEVTNFRQRAEHQEGMVAQLTEQLMQMEDERLERSLLSSCRANLKDELFSSWETDDTAASISEFTDQPSRPAPEDDLRRSTSSRVADKDENSLIDSDLDSSLHRRIFGPIRDDEVNAQGFSSLEDSSHDQARLKEMQKEYIASKFRM